MTEETLLLLLVTGQQSWDRDSTGTVPVSREETGERQRRGGCAPPNLPIPGFQA